MQEGSFGNLRQLSPSTGPAGKSLEYAGVRSSVRGEPLRWIGRRIARNNEILRLDRVILRSGNITDLEAFVCVCFFNAELL